VRLDILLAERLWHMQRLLLKPGAVNITRNDPRRPWAD
jgi:hypothetical protein